MILTCPTCTTKYRFEDSRIPERGIAVRCKKCRAVFRATRGAGAAVASASGGARPSAAPARPAAASAVRSTAPVQSATARKGEPQGSERSRPGGEKSRHSGPLPSLSVSPAASASGVSVSVPAGGNAASEADVKRLTRIILSDIVIYGPDRADQAIREGAFAEVYRAEIEEGRKMIRTRFPNAGNAVETYESCLRDLIETRRKELQTTANAL